MFHQCYGFVSFNDKLCNYCFCLYEQNLVLKLRGLDEIFFLNYLGIIFIIAGDKYNLN